MLGVLGVGLWGVCGFDVVLVMVWVGCGCICVMGEVFLDGCGGVGGCVVFVCVGVCVVDGFWLVGFEVVVCVRCMGGLVGGCGVGWVWG